MSENQSLMLQEAGQSPEVVATLLEKEKPAFAEIAKLFSSARPSVVTTAIVVAPPFFAASCRATMSGLAPDCETVK